MNHPPILRCCLNLALLQRKVGLEEIEGSEACEGRIFHHNQPWPSHQTTINAWNQMLTANKQHSQIPNTLFWPVSRKTRGLTSSPQISTDLFIITTLPRAPNPRCHACKGIEMPSLFAGNTASSAKECKHQTSVQLCCWAKLRGFAGKPSRKQG